jgi:ribosome-associated protein
MPTLQLRGDHITLAQALKAAGLTESGGQAKFLVREKQVLVNDEIETRPGRKLLPGDRFGILGGTEWMVSP